METASTNSQTRPSAVITLNGDGRAHVRIATYHLWVQASAALKLMPSSDTPAAITS
jgi:hypothetical protein